MTSFCPTCHKLVPSGTPILHSGVFLAKSCPECGISIELIESDPSFFETQERLPRVFTQNDCYMIDITSSCSAQCRSCYNNGGGHRSIVEFMREVDDTPAGSRILISGGEPLGRPNFETFVKYAAETSRHPVLLTNGAGLTFDNMEKLLQNGLYCTSSPQIAVSLGLPKTNNTFDAAYDNLKHIMVADIAFTVTCLDELDLVHEIAESLRGHYESVCIRTAWDGKTPGLHISEMVKHMNGGLIEHPTLHGYRNAMVEKDGIFYKILSWPTWLQYDVERYANRGVWYKGDNVVSTLVKNVTPFSL